MSTSLLNAFTVDVEDYFQVTAFEREISREQWPSMPSRVVDNTERLLELLAECDTKGTFFILGWVADRFPQLVQRIYDAGHQIGSHSYWHRLIYEQSPAEFREDLRRSRDVLEDITGAAVNCYRAPTFSIVEKSKWALEVLVEEGFTIDSSIFPVKHDRYGIAHAERGIHQVSTPSGEITEVPPATVRIFGRNMPVAGGGYFRLMPLDWTLRCIRQVNAGQNRPFMFYIHPWEADPGQPKVPAGSRLSQFRHRVNLSRVENRLQQMIQRFRFGRLDDVLEQTNLQSQELIAS